jgi:hypothetical protein
LWRDCNTLKEGKDHYQKEFKELKTIIPLMNEKKKKPVTEKIKDLHINSDVMYKRKFEMIKNNKPITIDQQPFTPMQLTVRPKQMFKIKRGEGNKLILQKVLEEENKIPPKENDSKEEKELEEENWLEKEDKEENITLINERNLEKEKEKKEEKEEEENIPKEKEGKIEELKDSLVETKPLASKLLMLSTVLGAIEKVKSLEEAIELTDGEKQYFSFGGKVMKCDGYFSKEQIF